MSATSVRDAVVVEDLEGAACGPALDVLVSASDDQGRVLGSW